MIINKFESVEKLNEYLKNSLNNSTIVKIDDYIKYFAYNAINTYIPSFQSLAIGSVDLNNFNSFVEANIPLESKEQWQSGFNDCNVSFYVYPFSKTNYRKNIHSNITESLYKKMYNFLKSVGIISAATGSYVIVSFREVTLDEFNNNFSEVETFDDKLLQGILNKMQDLNADNAYCIKVINQLEEKVLQLEAEKINLSNQISNKFLTTWS